nr:MAG TPA: hypothetical protein [Bacteriophage sp.]
MLTASLSAISIFTKWYHQESNLLFRFILNP